LCSNSGSYTFSPFVPFISGATLGKGLNIMLSTLVGGAPGVGAHHLPTR